MNHLPTCPKKTIHRKGTKEEHKTTCHGIADMTGNCQRTKKGVPRAQCKCLKCGHRYFTAWPGVIADYEAKYGPIPVQFKNGVTA